MGTPGHMAHPFDVDRVQTGQDLVDYLREAVKLLQDGKIAGSVKIDGINVSFKLVTDDEGRKDFRMDRGTTHTDSVIGMTAADAFKKWGPQHGMPQAIKNLLDIFNEAIPSIEPELKKLGMWDDPTKFFNTEYVEGKSNVQEYDKNFLAIHGINQFYEKKGPKKWVEQGISLDRPGLERPNDPETGKPIKGGSVEIPFDRKALESLIEKVKPIAAKRGFDIYGDIPATFDPDTELNLERVLDTPLSIQVVRGGVETAPLREWLKEVKHPKDQKVMKADGKSVGALSKDIYLAVLRSAEGGEPLSEYLESQEDVSAAISGALFYHATRLLGQAIKNSLTSALGSVGAHEGVVLRGMEPFLVKLTGDFIVQGLTSTHGDRAGMPKQKGKKIALYPGKFKPPHAGHFEVAREIITKPNIDKLIIYISPRMHEGITADQAHAIWEIYKDKIPGDIEIRIANVSPIGSVYDYLDKEAEEGDNLHLVLGEKDITDGRYAGAPGRREGVGVNVIPIPPQAGGISATQMRSALENNDVATFAHNLPHKRQGQEIISILSDQEISDILTLLGKGDLDETSGAGAVAGAAGAFGKPRRRNRKEDKLVEEVMDYLLGISVG